ncbi:MAG: hypothetical protein IJB01_06360 [Bacteroidaceae bacterium]|nr:hypothetical protein [Bacteroidaceae bacterium]
MKTTRKIWCSLILLALLGCKSVKVVKEDSGYSSHTNVVERIVHDSIFVHDSIYIRDKADTVFFTKYRTMYKERMARDTVMLRDTLYVERQTVKKSAPHNYGRKWLLFLMLPAAWFLYRVYVRFLKR